MDTILHVPRAQAPDFTLPDQTGSLVHLYDRLPTAGTALIFYRGHWCPYCRRYLAKLQAQHNRFLERGTQLLAISPEPVGTSTSLAAELGLAFPLLSDLDGAVIDRFGVRNGFAAVRSLMPHPAVFIVDGEGAIRFRNIDRNYKKRTTLRTIFAQLDDLASH